MDESKTALGLYTTLLQAGILNDGLLVNRAVREATIEQIKVCLRETEQAAQNEQRRNLYDSLRPLLIADAAPTSLFELEQAIIAEQVAATVERVAQLQVELTAARINEESWEHQAKDCARRESEMAAQLKRSEGKCDAANRTLSEPLEIENNPSFQPFHGWQAIKYTVDLIVVATQGALRDKYDRLVRDGH